MKNKLIDKSDIKFFLIYWLVMGGLCFAARYFDIRW